MNTKKLIKAVLLFFIFVLLMGTVFWGMEWFFNSLGGLPIHNNFFVSSLQAPTVATTANIAKVPMVNQNLFPLRNWQIEDLKIKAESAISVEIDPNGQSKFLFKKNEEEKLPIASLTKLMTALVVLNRYDLNEKITISESAIAQEGEQGDLKLGQILSAKNLLYIMLIESSNRAAYALAEVIGTDQFIALMNYDAQKIGLADTHFQDSSGLDAKSYSTVKDLAKLSEYIFENYPLFKQIISLKEYNLYLDDGTFHHTLINTNKLLGENNVIGGKTGFTNEALGCFMTIQNSASNGNYLINIVLGSDDRFLEMQNIINWVNIAYEW